MYGNLCNLVYYVNIKKTRMLAINVSFPKLMLARLFVQFRPCISTVATPDRTIYV